MPLRRPLTAVRAAGVRGGRGEYARKLGRGWAMPAPPAFTSRRRIFGLGEPCPGRPFLPAGDGTTPNPVRLRGAMLPDALPGASLKAPARSSWQPRPRPRGLAVLRAGGRVLPLTVHFLTARPAEMPGCVCHLPAPKPLGHT